jgi:hypothetical protein
MTAYSQMDYERLLEIAAEEAHTAGLSNEEYESLSIELWRKFGAERGLAEYHAPATVLPRTDSHCPLRSAFPDQKPKPRLYAAILSMIDR